MPSSSGIVLAAVLHAFRPLARLLLRHGVTYTAFSTALKQVFLRAAIEELRREGRKETDSAISLLSGVHRRDVRNLGRLAAAAPGGAGPAGMASQVVARWLVETDYLDAQGKPRALPRSGDAPSFDTLVASVSSDVRPRAVLDELTRLGMAEEADGQVKLREQGFVPRQGFEELAVLMRENLHDHLSAASLNLDGEHNFLEQAVFTDELTAQSAHELHVVSARAWRQAFQTVMKEAQARYAHDQAHAAKEQRTYRVRFGSYFYAADENDPPS